MSNDIDDLATAIHRMMYEQFNCDQAASDGQYCLEGTYIRNAISENKPVLVHCAAGTHRTGGVLATYHALFDRWTSSQIYKEMAEYDFRHKKNENLIPYLNKNISQMANSLNENGILGQVPKPLPVFITSN
jgi:protein tyrosine/serine phosphatase